jgi:hypothetical protein
MSMELEIRPRKVSEVTLNSLEIKSSAEDKIPIEKD